MLKRFVNLFKQDLTVAVRNYFHIVILALAALMIVLINFVFPASVKFTPNELFFDNSEGKVLESFEIQRGVDKSRFYQSREELMKAVEKNNASIGIIMEGTLQNARFTIIHQGTESEEIINVLDATIEEALDRIRGIEEKAGHRVEYLRPRTEPIPFNKNMIPVMVVTEAVMLGFLLISVMVFQEKEEGSVRAYRITPGSTLEYILSKAAVNLMLALVYALIMVVFTSGFNANYPAVILTVVLASFLMTMLGLAISVFFRNLQEFLFVGVFVLAVCGLPIASYFTPSFTPEFFTWIPSYPVLFGLREALFPTGKEGFIAASNLLLLVEGLVLLGIGWRAVHIRLMKDDKLYTKRIYLSIEE